MARHPYGPQARKRARNRTYTVLAIITVVVVIALMYGPFGADAEDENPADVNNTVEQNIMGFDPMIDDNETVVAEEEKPEVSEPNIMMLSVTENTPTETLPEVVNLTESEPDLTVAAPEADTISSTELNQEADTLIAEAAALIKQGSSGYVEARETLNQALRLPLSGVQRKYVKEQLSELANRWLFSRTVLPGDPLCEHYQVRPGEIFATIARKHKVPYEMLMDINNISNPLRLQAGQTIKVVNGPFHAKVHRSTFTMDIYLQNTYVRSYKVGLGKVETETPTGWWRVKHGGKLIKPIWTDQFGKTHHPEDPNYPLGSRWIALEGLQGQAIGRTGFAIHGTKEPEQIGSRGSMGCIRMHNGEAIMVYNMLYETLSKVEVTD